MRYDLQILVPVIPERLEGFQKYGLYNLKDKKVLLHCLIGTQFKQIYQKGWPKNIDIDIVSCEEDNAIIQIYKFLSNMKSEDLKSDWFAKIDDDTFNDINKKIERFNKIYDSKKEFYIVTEVRYEMEPCEIDILKKINVWEQIDEKFTHELEGCWLSNAAMNSILSNKKCKELFLERSKNKKGFTDQCMGAAAKICKIFPTQDYYSSVNEDDLFQTTLFKGKLHHYHPICQFKNKMNYEFVMKILSNNESSNLLLEILHKDFLLLVKNENKELICSVPLFFEQKNIVRSPSPEFCFYTMIGNDLIICRKEGYLQYYIFKNFNFKTGYSPQEPEYYFELLPYNK